KILNFARQKFHREGFYKISMDEIAKELHVSKKTIYKYFPSKEKLLEEICKVTSEFLEKHVDEIVHDKTDVVTKFVKLLYLHSNFMMNISEKWLEDLRIHAPGIKCEIDDTRDEKIIFITTKLLEEGKKAKLIENYPAPIIISILTSSFAGIFNPDFIIQNKFSLQDAFEYTYDIIMNGILTNKGKEKYKKTKPLLSKKLIYNF
ncbi:MAG: TetR/AcrR family transcriptional regulator, partial [Ignavibacteria bacterium]|nr:TetR/AcrR family transcriptional regulator [Ignavibacteria bacterium]